MSGGDDNRRAARAENMVEEDTVTMLFHNENDSGELTQWAGSLLAEATALQGTLHLPGVRDEYRSRREQVVQVATRALDNGVESREVPLLHWVLVQASGARAEDARYGAGQLSRGSQRAPTLEDCEDGWHRVEEIVCTAEEAALVAAGFARFLDTGTS